METNAKRAWAINAMLLAGLTLTAVFKMGPQKAQAVESGPGNNGLMINVGDPTERLVVVNTSPSEKKIMVYKTTGLGQFKLISARSYEFDQQYTDTSGLDDIEKSGYTVKQAVDVYVDLHPAPKIK